MKEETKPKMRAEITKTKYKGIPIVTIYPQGEMPMEMVEQIDKDVKEADVQLQLMTVSLKSIKEVINLLIEQKATIISVRRYPEVDPERPEITMIGVKGLSREDFHTKSEGDIYL